VRAFFLLPLLVVCPALASAQIDARIRNGAQVRLSTSQPESILAIGKVASIDSDSIVVDRGTADSPLRVALNDVTALEVYRRGKSAETSGFVFGTLGAAGGAALYVNWCLKNRERCQAIETSDEEEADRCEEDEDEEDCPLSTFGLVTLGFGMLGYVIGHSLAPPRWEVVQLPIRIGVAPLQRGVGVYVSLPAPRFAR
jgi:hypothetical protein